MTSVILQTAARGLQPLLLLFSLFLLFRGHHEPGGGFSGGLVAGSAVTLHAIAFGAKAARRALPVEPRTLVGAGLVLALGTAVAPLLAGLPLLTGAWTTLAGIELGTPLLFDAGVYVVVLGASLTVVLTFMEE